MASATTTTEKIDHTAAIEGALARLAEKEAALDRKLAELSARPAVAQEPSTSDVLREMLADQRKNAPFKNNADAPLRSVYTQYAPGDPRPKATLVREVTINGARMQEMMMTPQEVDATNALSASLPNPLDKRTSRGGTYIAEVDATGQRLKVEFPDKTIDTAMQVPASHILLCLELTKGAAVANVNSILERMVALEKQNEELTARIASLATAPKSVTSTPVHASV